MLLDNSVINAKLQLNSNKIAKDMGFLYSILDRCFIIGFKPFVHKLIMRISRFFRFPLFFLNLFVLFIYFLLKIA